MRTALPPFVNECEAWMLPETRCVRCDCKSFAWAGGGEGVGKSSHNARVLIFVLVVLANVLSFYAHDRDFP